MRVEPQNGVPRGGTANHTGTTQASNAAAFPRLLETSPRHTQIVLRLLEQHNELEEPWLTLRPHVIAVSAGSRLFDLSVMQSAEPALVDRYHLHMRLEESILHPAAIARMSPDDRRLMGLRIAHDQGIWAYEADRMARLIQRPNRCGAQQSRTPRSLAG